ncbi:MAG: NAD(P)H-binding protein [Gemmatimonadaceae bacterium]|nr:NAD(P)H-binding protein [Gemmatimonadaceae bacterium]
MKIAVAGGTGTVGRHVVAAAEHRGHVVSVLSRPRGVDVSTGQGLKEALTGIDVVIDVTNTMTLFASTARRFFETSTRHLLEAERNAGVRHHVALSIVGIDGMDASYYAGKLAQERAIADGSVPYTIARAAQFHEFAGQMLADAKGPIAIIPRMLMRPVAARDVGAHLVHVAEGSPSIRAMDLVGPRDEVLADLARRQLTHEGRRQRVFELRLPGAYGRGLASGKLRGSGEFRQASMTFDEWLTADDHRPLRR